jgi:short-subunit dehydrogenase
VLILGATSMVARAVAGELAGRGYDLALGGRDGEELRATAADLSVRFGVRAAACHFDALDYPTHPATLASALDLFQGELDGVVVCFGYMGEQETAAHDFDEARRILDTNFTACVSVLNPIADYLETRRRGFLCVLSSVAGDRGRQSNYIYGSAKAGLTAYLQGLRNRLFPAGIRVVTVKPGFMDTRMTYGRPGMFLVASPEAVARGIVRAIDGGADEVYLPGFWRAIMFIIRNIPERVFKRLKL